MLAQFRRTAIVETSTRTHTRMPAIDDFIIVTEVDHGPAFAAHIFERKYRAAAPA